MPINWGNVVTDPAERARILGLATDQVNRNVAGGQTGYAPGMSRDQDIERAAYSFFPTSHGSAPLGSLASLTGGPGGTGSAPQFGTSAPTPTPTGTFTGPDPTKVAEDPYYQFRAKQGEQALQRSAAAKGTLLTGGTLKALEGYRQGLASEEAGKAYDRALGTYTTNRDTNAQNYGQAMNQFQGNLAGFNANTAAGLGYGNLALNRERQAYEMGWDPRTGQFAPPPSVSSSSSSQPFPLAAPQRSILMQSAASAAGIPPSGGLGSWARPQYRAPSRPILLGGR